MNNKKKIILIIVLALVIICLFSIYYFGLSIRLIGDKETSLTINTEYFENGYIADFFGKRIDDENIIIEDNIDNSQFGDYCVTYRINFILPKEVKRIVHVVDDQKPEITLDGYNTVYINLNDEYEEAGYKCIDNYDGDLTNKVQITSNIDSSKIGSYEIKYSVFDSSNNISEVIRRIEVIDSSILTADVKDFWLDGYFENVVLKKQDEVFEHFDDVVFVGDSNIKYIYKRGEYLPAKQVWARDNLTIAEINSNVKFCVYEYSENDNYTFSEAMEKIKPNYLIVSVGIKCAIDLSKEEFVDQINKFVNNMRTHYPNVKFALLAILPIAYEGTLSPGNQILINQYNYYLLETCHKLGVNVIYISDEIKDESGYGKKDYYEYLADYDRGFHLSQKGKEFFIDYVSHLDLEREVS